MKDRATAEELNYWRKVARDCATLDETTRRGGPDQRAELLAWVNRLRAKDGQPPLTDTDDDPPELEFYRIAGARGLLRPPGRRAR